MMSENLRSLYKRKGIENSLFKKLQELSQATGTPSHDALESLAESYLSGPAQTYGAASFYDFLCPEHADTQVYLCNGSCCQIAQSQDKLKSQLKEHFSEEQIGHQTCLGRCYENSALQLDGRNYSGSDLDLQAIINDDVDQHTENNYHVGHIETQVLSQKQTTADAPFNNLKEILSKSPQDLLKEIKTSQLRGRGGAGFPVGFKWQSCMEQVATQKFIVCNADEGDPGAYSDRYLMEEQPFLVLFGMLISGYICGADCGILYIRKEYPESIGAIEAAIDLLREKNILNTPLNSSGFSFDFHIIEGAGAYICGEETALLSSIEGLRPEVRVRPPYPTVEGLFGYPTIVNNVETLASIWWILTQGGNAFAALGTAKSSGTKLISLDGQFNRPGIYEVPMGTSLTTVIQELGQGTKQPIKAYHIGGPLGGLVPHTEINTLTIDFESFAESGFLLGHGSVVCIPQDYPLIKYLTHLFAFTAVESCGKCFPCRLGSKRGEELLQKAEKGQQIDRQLFDDLLDTLELGSLCALGGGLPLPIRNTLQYFPDELAQYFSTTQGEK